MPYFEPSRPMPLSFMPPKGAISVEMMPSLMPTMPYSPRSARIGRWHEGVDHDARGPRPTRQACFYSCTAAATSPAHSIVIATWWRKPGAGSHLCSRIPASRYRDDHQGPSA
jgi:hypothetical protein